jgi:tRNA(Ile2) C34 agmatinyltransferase TiaS
VFQHSLLLQHVKTNIHVDKHLTAVLLTKHMAAKNRYRREGKITEKNRTEEIRTEQSKAQQNRTDHKGTE